MSSPPPRIPRVRFHLVRRFFGSLRRSRPSATDTAWAHAQLDGDERIIFDALSAPDQRHAVAVARRVEHALRGTAWDDRRWIAAALLHDSGKLDAGLGTFGRVVATVAGGVVGRERARRWSRPAPARRIATYLRHPELGAVRIQAVGGRAEVATWAGVHHTPGAWSATGIPEPVVMALHAADDD